MMHSGEKIDLKGRNEYRNFDRSIACYEGIEAIALDEERWR